MPQRKKNGYTAKKNQNSKPGEGRISREQYRQRWQQIIFIAIAVVLILSWILTLVVR
ncbi:MAG: hypothetical protein HPY76_01650 [Anaerolineae bacterium]|jgi:predicted nucleic acid-binding Zn ribbon protein|nr:hypothetical protein [Anaerolineae bacterium]